MMFLRRGCALLLALVLTLAPFGSVSAIERGDGNDSASIQSEVSSTGTGTGGSGLLDDARITFDCADECLSSGWYTEFNGATLTVSLRELSSSSRIYYIKNYDISSHENIPIVSSPDRLTKVAEIPALPNGKHKVVVVVTNKASEDIVKEILIHVDNGAPDISSLSLGSINIRDGVGYAGEFYTITGARDPVSGMGKAETLVGGQVTGVYSAGNGVRIYEDTEEVRFYDVCGNSVTVAVSDVVSKFCKQIVFDTTLPSVSLAVKEPVGYEYNTWSYYKGKVTLVVSATDDNLSSVTVYARGGEIGSAVLSGASDEATFILSDENSYDVEVFVKDKSGNTAYVSKNICIDNTAPSIGSLSLGGNWVLHNGAVVTNSSVTINGSPSDKGSGVRFFEVRRGEELLSSELPFTLSESGSCEIYVEDNVGNSASFSISDLSGGSVNSVIVDTKAPTISIEYPTPAENGVRGIWFVEVPTFIVSAVDDLIASVEIFAIVDGEMITVVSETTNVEDYAVDFELWGGLSNSILVKASDVAGNVYSKSVDFCVDKSAPVIKDIEFSPEPALIKDGKMFFTSDVDISIVSSDEGYGEVSYSLNGMQNKDGVYSDLGSGSYFVEVSDGLGNKSESKALGYFFGEDVSEIVVVTEPPKIDATGLNGAWVASPPVYVMSISDVAGIDSYSVSIDGVEVDIKSYETSSQYSAQVVADFGDVTSACISGEHILKVTVVNNAGISSTWSDIVKLDLEKPELGDLSAVGSWNEVQGYVYSSSAIVIEGNAVDVHSGVKYVNILDGSEIVGTSIPYTIAKSGTYFVEVCDNVGNILNVPLASLFGTESNSVVIDSEVPFIELDSESVSPTAVVDGKDWYNSNPAIRISVSDNIGVTLKVVLTVDGEDSEVYNGYIEKEGSVTIDTSLKSGVEYSLFATVSDHSGNSSSVSYSFALDMQAPEAGSLAIVSEYVSSEEGSISGDRFYLTGTSLDVGSGIARLSVYKDGVLCFESADGSVNWSITEESDSGVYSVVVEDRVGNRATFNANMLLGSASSNLVVDKTSPVVEFVSVPLETKEGWYKDAPVFGVYVNDSRLQQYTVLINDEVVHSGYVSESFEISTSEFINMPVTITVRAKDIVGNSFEISRSYSHDNIAPSNLVATLTSQYAEKGGTVFFKSPADVEFSAEDTGYANIVYFVNGVVLDGFSYTVSSNGSYSVYASDGLGNMSDVFELAELLGWSGNTVVIDSDNPEISSERYNHSWVSDFTKYVISVSDAVGLDSIVVQVNDVVVAENQYAELNETSYWVEVDLAEVAVSEDGRYEVRVYATDNSGRSSTWSDVVYVDTGLPEVSGFEITGYTNATGKTTNGGEDYGFFFNGNGSVVVSAKDPEASSGLSAIWTRFEGQEWVEHLLSDSTSVVLTVPTGFKGLLEAYAVDNVGHKSAVNSPDRFIDESASSHANNSYVSIILPNISNVDKNGLPLYNSEIYIDVVAGCSVSGVSKIEWLVEADGMDPLSGSEVFEVETYDRNLATQVSSKIVVFGNLNNMSITITATDMAGHKSYATKKFSIDRDKPIISVVYDEVEEDSYYECDRTATVTVVERNFDPSLFVVDGSFGTLSPWVQDGDNWSAKVLFSENKVYEFSLNCTDMAGNVATTYESDAFVVDKISPVIERVDENSETASGWYNYAPVLKFHIEETNLSMYQVYVNGLEVATGSSNDFSVDTSEYVNMPVSVYIVATDKSGNSSEYSYSYNHDNLPPVNVDVIVEEPVFQKGDVVYFNDAFVVTIVADDGVGFGDLKYSLNSLENGSGEFKITSSGEYLVSVKDGLGHATEWIALGRLAKWQGNKVIVNNEVPSISFSKLNGVWVNAHPIYDVTVGSAIGLNSVTISVNGEVVLSKSYDATDVVSDTLSVDLSSYDMADNSSYSIVVTVEDNSKLTSSDSDIVFVDLNPAEIGTMSAEGIWEVHDSIIFSNSVINLTGYPVDIESGVALVEVLKDGEYVGSLPYTITESGTYSVRVVDAVGNEVIYSLADVAKETTSTVVLDAVLPEVYFDMGRSDKPQYSDGSIYWYQNNPVIYVGMADANLVSVSVSVTIDGTCSVLIEDILADGIYAIDTSYAQGKEFLITAFARDKGGNTSEASYSFFVDKVAPSVGDMSAIVTPYGVEDDSIVYISGQFSISGMPVDSDSGLRSVQVFCNNDTALTEYNYLLLEGLLISEESQSGEYWVVITDNVGNETRIGFGEMIGCSTDNVIIDKTRPEIVRTDSNEETAIGWYNYAPVLSFNISDTYIKNYSVAINGSEVISGFTSKEVFVDTKEYLNQEVEVVVAVEDKAGNIYKLTYSYQHDNACPKDISVVIGSPSNQKGGNVYYNGQIDLSVSANDSAYGNIEYYINGVRIEGQYTIAKSGSYSLEVKDGLGNSTGVIPFKDYLGWSGNNIIIDEEAPSISSNRYDDSWIKGVGSYSIKIEDNSGINSIVIKSNGVEVGRADVSATNQTVEEMEVNTEMAPLNADGSFKTTVIVTDNSGLSTSWTDTVYVDNVVPAVNKFNIQGYVNTLETKDGYGYFFSGGGTIDVLCEDSSPSGGLKSVWTRFSGYDWKEIPVGGNGVVTVEVPDDFKGSFEAYVVDAVGNISEIKSPAMLISETSASKDGSVKITLADTPYTDVNGLPLYNSDLSANISVSCGWSGLQSLTWGVDGSDSTITDFSGGVFNHNIASSFEKSVVIGGNSNGIKLSATATDWANYSVSEEVLFSVDKDVPIIAVSFNSSVDNNCYRVTRVAHITVTERNFDPAGFAVGGATGVLGTWSNDGDVWSNTISFSEDGTYGFTLDCTDRAGNVASQYVSESFIIDKVLPVLSVSWDNMDVENGMYYKAARTATVSVVEKNFNSSLFSLSGSGSLSAWSTYGDTHTATVEFNTDGDYNFSISGADMAGNTVESAYSSGRFIIDLTPPEVSFANISNGVSYKENVEFTVSVEDLNLDDGTQVFLSGKTHDLLEVNGIFEGTLGSFSYSNFPMTEDVDDIYEVSVFALDKAGNVTEGILVFSVNRFGSSYSFYSAELLGNYLGSVGDVVIYETNVDKLDTEAVVITIVRDGKETVLDSSLVKISEEFVNGKYVYTYTISSRAFLEDGKYSITIMSFAEEGSSYTSASEQYDFIVDQTAPSIIISGVEDGEDYHEYERVVAVDARDLYGLQTVRFYVNDVIITDYQESDGVYTFTVQESEYSQNIRVEAVDMAGNVAESSVKDFLITSNLLVYLINQVWFWIAVGFVLLLIILMIILLLRSRLKDRNREKEAIKASGELYRSSASSGSAGSTSGSDNQILSGESPEVQQGSVPQDSSVPDAEMAGTTTGVQSESTTGFMDEGSDTNIM